MQYILCKVITINALAFVPANRTLVMHTLAYDNLQSWIF